MAMVKTVQQVCTLLGSSPPPGPEADSPAIMVVFTVEHGWRLLSPACQGATGLPVGVAT